MTGTAWNGFPRRSYGATGFGGRRTGLRLSPLVLLSLLTAVALPLSAVAAPLPALQARPDARLESRMLRQASSLEARGELDQAEATLRELLALQPGSSAAVFALERVYRKAGRLPELLPVLDGLLGQDASLESVWGLKVGVLVEVDSLAALEGAVRDWIEAGPGSPNPYLEGAEAFLGAFGADRADRATALIEEGIAAMGESPQLLVELGDMYVAAGRLDDAAESWARALGRDRARSGAVFRRVEDLGDESGAAAARIVAALGSEPTNVTRLEAGAELALREDLEDDAMSLAAAALTRLEVREARGFLNGFARKAEDNGRDRSALWAYARLREMTADPAEARSTDERLADAALAAGDTVVALEARRRITQSYRTGSEARGTAWTERTADPGGFAGVGGGRRGPRRVPRGVPGVSRPRRSFRRARLAPAGTRDARRGDGGAERDRGAGSGAGKGVSAPRRRRVRGGHRRAAGVSSRTGAVPRDGDPRADPRAERAESPRGMLASEVAIARHRGQAEDGVRAVQVRIDAVPAQDRAAILAQGARAADEAGLAAEAVQFRRRIVAEYPDAREFAEAALRLARAVAAEPGGRDEAVRILEALIVSRPDSPVVPGARRELRRIQEGGSR